MSHQCNEYNEYHLKYLLHKLAFLMTTISSNKSEFIAYVHETKENSDHNVKEAKSCGWCSPPNDIISKAALLHWLLQIRNDFWITIQNSPKLAQIRGVIGCSWTTFATLPFGNFSLQLRHLPQFLPFTFSKPLEFVLDFNGFIISVPAHRLASLSEKCQRINKLKCQSKYPISISKNCPSTGNVNTWSFLPTQIKLWSIWMFEYVLHASTDCTVNSWKNKTYSVLISFQFCIIFCSFFLVALSQHEKQGEISL